MPLTDHPDDIQAYVTDQARAYRARAINGELAFKAQGFSVGRGGYDPADPVKILPVGTADTQLIDQVFPDVTGYAAFQAIDAINETTRVFNCRLPATTVETNADYALGEIGIWAEILHSENPVEIGQVFLYALGHMPIISKTRRSVFLFRVVINY